MMGTGIMERADNAGSVTLGITQTSIPLPEADIFHTMQLSIGSTGTIDTAFGTATGDAYFAGFPAALTTAFAAPESNFVITAKGTGEAGNDIKFKLTKPAFPLSSLLVIYDPDPDGLKVEVFAETDASGDIVSNASQIVDALRGNDYLDDRLTFELAADNDGTGIVEALAETNLNGGVDGLGMEARPGDGMGKDHQGLLQPSATRLLGLAVRTISGKASFALGGLSSPGPWFLWADPAGNAGLIGTLTLTADVSPAVVIVDLIATSQS